MCLSCLHDCVDSHIQQSTFCWAIHVATSHVGFGFYQKITKRTVVCHPCKSGGVSTMTGQEGETTVEAPSNCEGRMED